MRRVSRLFERIVELENLRLATWKALRGKRDKLDARDFVAALEENLSLMQAGLRTEDLPLGISHQFTIHDPKERVITAPCFQERVLHHAIMNLCEPEFERRLCHDIYACRTGKGRIAALERAQTFAGRHGWFLKLDMRKYFDSIWHDRLLASLSRVFKDRALLLLLQRIIQTHSSAPGRGLPIGALTSQHFANFYLAPFDRFAVEHLRAKYVRYMDDCVLWGEDRNKLARWRTECVQFLADQLGLEPKTEPYVNRTTHGMDFLGCRVFPKHIILNRRSRVRYGRKLQRLHKAMAAGSLTEREFQDRATALTAFTQHPICSYRFRQSVLEFEAEDGLRPRTGSTAAAVGTTRP